MTVTMHEQGSDYISYQEHRVRGWAGAGLLSLFQSSTENLSISHQHHFPKIPPFLTVAPLGPSS